MTEITLKIDGMMCGMCEAHINDAIRNEFSVNKVTSSHAKGQTVIVVEDDLSNDDLVNVVEKTGYKVLDISKKPYEKKGMFSFLKK